ncbi:hypothetical protein BG004_004596 [Podila humilis]|nr:hypothetical protein BG004_004596 [Podila humilis]
MDKRKDPPTSDGVLIKRQKPEESTAPSNAIAIQTKGASGALVQTVKRTSALKAPIMLLQGQTAELYTCKFSPSGEHVASAGAEKSIYLWNTYGDCTNYGIIKGHIGAILELHWSRDGSMIFTASADKTCGVYDVETGERIKRFKGHTSFVNSCSPARRGPELLASGSDDGSVKIWDLRSKNAVESFDSQYQITSVSFSQAGDLVFAGGIDNNIAAWDMRKKSVSYSLAGHMDTVSGMSLSPDGNQLLSNGMDNTVRIWDVKPFSATGSRLLKTLEGAPHGFEKNLIRPAWSKDGAMVGVGAGDRTMVIWDALTQKILYKLPGHKGCVNEVDFHPKEPIGAMVLFVLLLLCASVTIAQEIYEKPQSVQAPSVSRTSTHLYVLGGNETNNFLGQFFKLDLTVPWKNENPAWTRLRDGPHQLLFPSAWSKDEKTLVVFHCPGAVPVYLYSAETNEWTPSNVRSQLQELQGVGAVTDPQTGLVHLAGGYMSIRQTMDTYDFATDTMTAAILPTRLFSARSYYGNVWSKSRNSILYFGGYDAKLNQVTSGSLVTEYVPATALWQTVVASGVAPGMRADHCMASNDDGTLVVIFGGRLSSGSIANDLHVFNTVTQSWVQGSPGPYRLYTACTIAGDLLLVWGGVDQTFNRVKKDMFVYNITSMLWLLEYTPPQSYLDKSPTDSKNRPTHIPISDSSSSPLDPGVIAGVSIACVALLCFMVLFLIFKRRRRNLGSLVDTKSNEDVRGMQGTHHYRDQNPGSEAELQNLRVQIETQQEELDLRRRMLTQQPVQHTQPHLQLQPQPHLQLQPQPQPQPHQQLHHQNRIPMRHSQSDYSAHSPMYSPGLPPNIFTHEPTKNQGTSYAPYAHSPSDELYPNIAGVGGSGTSRSRISQDTSTSSHGLLAAEPIEQRHENMDATFQSSTSQAGSSQPRPHHAPNNPQFGARER